MAAINREKLMRTAQGYVAAGKLDRAVKEYEKLLEQDPRDPTLLNTVGDLYLSLGKTSSAVEYFKRAAQKYIDEAFYGKGLAVYRKIVKSDQRNMENTEVLADLFMKEGLQSDAKKYYAEIGKAYLQSQNFSKAYQVFKKLGDLTLDDPAIHLKLANLSIQIGVRENARDSFQMAASILCRKGEFREAHDAIGKALEIDPGSISALKLLFKISMELREYGALKHALESALHKDPSNAALREMLGQSCLFEQNLEGALRCFEVLYAADESKVGLMCDLADAAVRLKDPDLAVSVFSRVANHLLSKRENGKVESFYQSVLKSFPKHVPALEGLADFYHKVSDNYNYIVTVEMLSVALMEKDENMKALSTLETLLTYEPKNERFQNYHRQVFQKLYPDEPYTPFGAQEEEESFEIPGQSIFQMDTAELSSGQAFDGRKESDAAIEIELLMSYGLRDKAKVKLKEKIQADPGDVVYREKLKELLKEEGDLKAAAAVCFELVNAYTLNGEHEKAGFCAEEGKNLDPNRFESELPTGLLTGKLEIRGEAELPTGALHGMGLEDDGADLSEDLSDILGMEDLPDEVKLPPRKAGPAVTGRATISQLSGAKEEGAVAEEEEIVLESLEDDGFDASMLVEAAEKNRAVRQEAPSKEPEADLFELLEAPIPEPSVTTPMSFPEKPAEIRIPHEAPAVKPKKRDSQMETDINIRLEQTLKSLEDIGLDASLLGFGNAPSPPPRQVGEISEDADAASLLSLLGVGPEPRAQERGRLVEPPSAPLVPSAQLVPELETGLQEVDFYLKLGFQDNARDELKKLHRSFPDHPEVLSRMGALGMKDLQEPKPALPVTRPASPVAPPPKAAVPRAPVEEPAPLDLDDEALMQDISADDVSIDLFNFIPPEPYAEEGKILLPSAEARKLSPDLSFIEGRASAARETEAEGMFAGIGADEIEDNFDIFSPHMEGGKPGADLADLSTDLPGAVTAGPQKAGAGMQSLFADLVEEANKIFVASGEDEDGDFDTHYNLGIAYKEMGLTDDAIGEFQKAYNLVKDESRSSPFIQACNMLSLCFFEKGIYKSAIKWCERGLESPGHQEHEYLALKYDMMNAYEKMGDAGKALDLGNEILEISIGYRDVAEKVKYLKNQAG